MLFESCEKGDLNGVQRSLKTGENINRKNEYNFHRTPLIYAAMKGHLDIVEYLIHEAADVDLTDVRGKTALNYALDYHFSDIAQLLTSASTLMCDEDPDEVIRTGSIPNFRRLLNSLDHIDYRDNQTSWTMLMRTTMFNRSDLIQTILDRGACVNLVEKYGTSALMFASRLGNLAAIELLLERGANVNLQNNYGATALHFASENGHALVAAVLINRGADLNLKTELGETAFMRASMHGHSAEVAEVLIDKGALIYSADEDGKMQIITDEKIDSMRNLISQIKGETEKNGRISEFCENISNVCSMSVEQGGGAVDHFHFILNTCTILVVERPRNIIDKDGTTLIMSAAKAGHADLVEELLRSVYFDVDINAQDNEGRTALLYACRRNDLRLVRLLLSTKADPCIKSHDGGSPYTVTSNGRIQRLLLFQENLISQHRASIS